MLLVWCSTKIFEKLWAKSLMGMVNKFKVPNTHKGNSSLNYEPKFNYSMNPSRMNGRNDLRDQTLKSLTNENDFDDTPPKNYFDESPLVSNKAKKPKTNLNSLYQSNSSSKAALGKSDNKTSRVKKKEVLNTQKRHTLNNLNSLHKFTDSHKSLVESGKYVKPRNSIQSNVDVESLKSTKETPADPATILYDQVMQRLKENADMDLLEKEMNHQFQAEKAELQQEFEAVEKELVDAMQQYIDVEEQVCDLESHDINVHHKVHDLMAEYQEILDLIQKEKVADPLTVAKI
jgi:hypothetical protein